MSWPLPYTILPFRIPPPLMIITPGDNDLPIDLSIDKHGKSKLPTPPPTPDTPCSSSGCQSPRFDALSFGIMPMPNEQERAYDCVDCSYTTRRRTNLKRHIQSMHSQQEVVNCCGSNFYSKADFRSHVKEVHQNGYKCQLCNRGFCRKALLKRHMSVHNGIKEFNCKLCHYATSHKSNLERHQRVHNRYSNSSILPRSAVPLVFSHLSHVLTPPPETPEKTNDVPVDMTKKQLQHEQSTCTNSDRMIAFRMATEEVLALQQTSKLAGSQRLCADPYKCVQCDKRFKTQKDLTIHEIQTHPNRRADAFQSFPLKYQLKIVYNAINQTRENSE